MTKPEWSFERKQSSDDMQSPGKIPNRHSQTNQPKLIKKYLGRARWAPGRCKKKGRQPTFKWVTEKKPSCELLIEKKVHTLKVKSHGQEGLDNMHNPEANISIKLLQPAIQNLYYKSSFKEGYAGF